MSTISSPNDNSIMDCEGASSTQLYKALDTTCIKFISSIKFSLLKKTYKEIYKKNPEALKEIHEQLRTVLKASITEDLNILLKEQMIDSLLNTLDYLKKSQDPSQPSWRPSGNPEEDLRDHLYPVKLDEKGKLEEMLLNLSTDNEILVNKAAVHHAEIMHIKKTNESMHEKFTNIVTSIAGPNFHSLRGTVKDLEELKTKE